MLSHLGPFVWGRASRLARCLAYLVVLSAVIGCERQDYRERGRKKLENGGQIVLVGPSREDPQWPGICGGALRFMAGVPTVRVECVVPEKDTVQSMRELLEAQLAREPAAICVYVTPEDVAEPTALRANLDRIARAQVLLVTMGCNPNDPRVYGHVNVDLEGGAELLGSSVERLAADRRSYVLVHEDGADQLASAVYARFASGIRHQHATDWHLLEAVNTAERGNTPADAVVELLKTFPHVGVVVTLNPKPWLDTPPGWIQDLRGLNARFQFATLTTSPALWGRLGTPALPGTALALVGPLDGDIGYAAVDLVVQALVSEREAVPRRTIPCEVVTAETLVDFARRYAESANGLDVMPYLGGALPVTTSPAGG